MNDLLEVDSLLTELNKERNQVVVDRNRLDARLRELNQTIEALSLAKRLISGSGRGEPNQPPLPKEEGVVPLRPDVSELQMPQAIKKILEGRGGRGKISEIADALEAAGRLRRGNRRSNYSRVYRTMTDRPAIFVKVGEGEFGLVEQLLQVANSGATRD